MLDKLIIKRLINLGLFGLLFYSLSVLDCATTHYVRPDEVTEWDYTFSDTDMKMMAEKMVYSIAGADITGPTGKPKIAFLTIGNRTSQHIDTEAIAEKIMVALLKLNNVAVVDRKLLKNMAIKKALTDLQRIDVYDAVQLGQLVDANYFLAGDIMSIEKTSGTKALAYYKLTLRLVDVRTSLIVWADEMELKKMSQKGYFDW
jgi:uncharacterized protein (TIGR02722 family)